MAILEDIIPTTYSKHGRIVGVVKRALPGLPVQFQHQATPHEAYLQMDMDMVLMI
jgi:hypothetical protein